uniref:EamA domain-containing protein n=1 Tax=viral metagenome TaxID=1070528 RepID=A0A6C0KL40_9ZZZZ
MDAFVLSSLKAYHLGWIEWRGILLVSMVIYACQPLLFLQSLGNSSLTIMNLLWDVMSDVIVTSIGLYYFSEKIGPMKKMGVVLSIVSIFLLTWKED